MPRPHSISRACSTTGTSISASSLPRNGSHVGTGSASWIWSSRLLALAPRELARVERDDHQHEDGKRPRQQVQHLPRHRPCTGAEDVAGRRAGHDQEQHAGKRDDAEIDVLDRFAEVEPHQPRQQANATGPGGRDAAQRARRRCREDSSATTAARGRPLVPGLRHAEAPRREADARAAPIASHSSRFQSSSPSSGTRRVLRSLIDQYAVICDVATTPNGSSIDASVLLVMSRSRPCAARKPIRSRTLPM